MIIGNGLIANAIKGCDNNKLLLFASGVSNSVTPSQSNFLREEQLILSHINSDKLFVYFSTVSIYDGSVNTKAYIKHKLAMESLITKTANNYLILRLPNIIGEKGNPNTLFPFFKRALLNNIEVSIDKNAHRYLLTTSQLQQILKNVLNEKPYKKIINCILGSPFPVKDIYHSLAQILEKEPNCILVDGGESYEVPKNFKFNLEAPSLEEMLRSVMFQTI